MKISSAISLILPMVEVSLASRGEHTFESAVDYNLCAKLGDTNYMWGPVRFYTLAAICLNEKTMSVQCGFRVPSTPLLTAALYTCTNNRFCVPVVPPDDVDEYHDAGCLDPGQPSGVKGNRDYDSYACSAGINTGSKSIYLMSSISADNPAQQSGMNYCTVIRTQDRTHVTKKALCDKTSQLIKLAARSSYQACIHTATSLALVNVGFHWHLSSAAKLVKGSLLHPRGLDDGELLPENGQPLSEMFTIDNSTATTDAVQIVIGD